MQHNITEQYLKQGQFKSEYYKRVEFSEIDLVKSEANPARMNRRLDHDRALSYGLAMEQGTEFPALVLLNLEQPHGRVKFEVATGMHRINGAQAAHRNWFDAYIVTEADKYRREVLIRQLNTLEGRGVSENEKIAHVLQLNEIYPTKTLTQLAKEWNLKAGTVQAAAAEQRARLRARRFNYDLERNKIPQKVAIHLGQIHSDKVFEKALELYLTIGHIQSSEVRDMVNEIKKARDETASLAIVERYREIAEQRALRGKAKRARVRPSHMVRFLGDVRRCNGHFDKPITELHIAQLDNRDQVLALEQVRELMENLKGIEIELQRVATASRTQRPGSRPTAPGAPEMHA